MGSSRLLFSIISLTSRLYLIEIEYSVSPGRTAYHFGIEDIPIGILNCCPGKIIFISDMLLWRTNSSTVVPKYCAIPHRVLPGSTVYKTLVKVITPFRINLITLYEVDVKFVTFAYFLKK